MSLKLNDTSDARKGIVQIYEKEIRAQRGFVSGSPDRLKDFIADANLAWDDFLKLAFEASGTHQFDDSTHGDYPIIKTDLVSGQRDYPILTDEQGNFVLEIFKVLVADRNGTFIEVPAVDAQTERDTGDFWDGETHSGVPTKHDKTANGIIFDKTPDYNMRLVQEGQRGVKIYVNREAYYFVFGSNSVYPGCPGIFHEYFAINPAYKHAARKGATNEQSLLGRMLSLEGQIKAYFGRREHDKRKRLTPLRDSNK